MCLQGELDELEREEFFRLKKVQKNKQKHAAQAEQQKVCTLQWHVVSLCMSASWMSATQKQ